MPITAKLSQQFYERLGDDIANELVGWFNSVDATYRSDLRELNELNFARFDAKQEQRLARIEHRSDWLEARLTAFEARLNERFAAFEARVDARMAQSETRMIRWMFAFWTGQTLALAGLMYAMLHAP